MEPTKKRKYLRMYTVKRCRGGSAARKCPLRFPLYHSEVMPATEKYLNAKAQRLGENKPYSCEKIYEIGTDLIRQRKYASPENDPVRLKFRPRLGTGTPK